MSAEDKQVRRLRQIAAGSGFTISKARGGAFTITDDKTGASIEEPSIRDVAIRLQRMGVLGYGGAE